MITPGAHVEAIPLPAPNPWIDQKRGWAGVVVHEMLDVPGHVRVLFEGRARHDIMPVAALRLVQPSDRVKKPEAMIIPPDAPRVRVRPNAGTGAGEEHVVRRRGQIGRVIAECGIATGFRIVVFGADLPVMIHRDDLVALAAAPKQIITIRQLGLPIKGLNA